MHFERLVIESGSHTFGLDLHPKLTVVAGAGDLERDGLINELIGALGPGRSGVHAELRADDGTRYAVFRPAGGEHRVVDIDAASDVSHRFRDSQGRVSVLGRAGLDIRSARRLLRLTDADLAISSHEEEMELALAQVEQGRLWDVADKVLEREAAINDLEAETGSGAHDAALVEEIERRHARFEEEEARHEDMRRGAFVLGASAGIAVVPAAILTSPVLAVLLMIVAVGATSMSIAQWRKMEAARIAETEALQQVGADSYLSYQIHRVNSRHGSASQRRRLVLAAEAHRAALSEWQVLVGDIPVDWAIEHRQQVLAASRRVRSSDLVRNPMAVALSAGETTAVELAEVLRERAATLEHAGPRGESLPLLLDEPLCDIAAEAKAILLEALTRSSRRCQMIYLTNDPDVAAWARLEAITGELSIVEPPSGSNGPDNSSPGRPRHVAA